MNFTEQSHGIRLYIYEKHSYICANGKLEVDDGTYKLVLYVICFKYYYLWLVPLKYTHKEAICIQIPNVTSQIGMIGNYFYIFIRCKPNINDIKMRFGKWGEKYTEKYKKSTIQSFTPKKYKSIIPNHKFT